MASPIRILDLRDSSRVDGPGRTVLETAECLDPSEFEVLIGSFVPIDAGQTAYLQAAQDKGLKTLKIRERKSLDLQVIRQVSQEVSKRRIDLIHTHDLRSNIVGLICARQTHVPIVATCHGWIANDIKGRIYRWIDRRILKRFDQVVTVSNAMKDQLTTDGFNSPTTTVIVNSLAVHEFNPDKSDRRFRHELGISDATTVIACIGRLSPEKGQELLLRAIARVRQEFGDICVVIVGDGNEERNLRDLVPSLGIDNIVHFVGYRHDMSNVYNSVDVVVQCSHTEGMPNVVLESLLMRTPVLATDVGGTPEIIGHLKTGYLMRPKDEGRLVDALLHFLGNQQLHQRLAARGRHHVIANFDHKNRVKVTAQLYSAIASQEER